MAHLPCFPIRMYDIHEVGVIFVEPRLWCDVEPVEGVGHVTGEQRPGGVEAGDAGQPRGGDVGEAGAGEAADVRPEAVTHAVEAEAGVEPVGEAEQGVAHTGHHPRHGHAHVPGVGRGLVVIERVLNEGEKLSGNFWNFKLLNLEKATLHYHDPSPQEGPQCQDWL